MCNRKDYINYLMLELDKFTKWYTKDSDGFGNNKNMLYIFEGMLTALTIISFNSLNKELEDSINKVQEIIMILSPRSGKADSAYTSHALVSCYKALSTLVNKLK